MNVIKEKPLITDKFNTDFIIQSSPDILHENIFCKIEKSTSDEMTRFPSKSNRRDPGKLNSGKFSFIESHIHYLNKKHNLKISQTKTTIKNFLRGGKISMKTLTLITLSIFINLMDLHTIEAQNVTTPGVPFLLIAPNSRFGGMGETGAAISDDASAMFWNSSGLAFQKTGAEINVTHSPWLAGLGLGDLFYDYVAGKKYIKDINGTIGASLTYLNIGEVAVSDEFGNVQKERNYNSYELAFALGYATMFGNNWAGGISSRFIYSRLSPNDNYVAGEKGTGTGISASFDLSAMFRPAEGSGFFKNRFSAGINLSNIGPDISYVDAAQADPLPTQLRLGFSYGLIKSEFNNLTLAADFSKLLINRSENYTGEIDSKGKEIVTSGVDPFYKAMFTSWKGGATEIAKSIQTSIGAEYWYGSPKLIALRAGYFYEDPSNGNRKYYTLGAGIRYSHYGFDMSYMNTIEEYHPLANTLRFGLSINFK